MCTLTLLSDSLDHGRLDSALHARVFTNWVPTMNRYLNALKFAYVGQFICYMLRWCSFIVSLYLLDELVGVLHMQIHFLGLWLYSQKQPLHMCRFLIVGAHHIVLFRLTSFPSHFISSRKGSVFLEITMRWLVDMFLNGVAAGLSRIMDAFSNHGLCHV